MDLLKKDKASFDDGFARNDFNHAKAYRPEIFEKLGKLEFLLTGEKFVADLIAKKAVKLAYSGQPKLLGTADEQNIREKIKVTSNKVLVDLRGVEDGILNLKAGATFLPDHLDVRGKLVLLDSDVTELPEFLNVTGNLILNEKIKELPDSIRVGGDLMLGTTAYQSMYDRAFELKDKGRIGGRVS